MYVKLSTTQTIDMMIHKSAEEDKISIILRHNTIESEYLLQHSHNIKTT